MLFESLIKCTTDEEELSNIKTSYKRSRVILNHVNQAVREAEDELRLLKIQQKLDLTPFEKVEQPLSEFRVKIIINKFKVFCFNIPFYILIFFA